MANETPIVFCDLDEVITDFTGAAIRLHGWTKDQLEEAREPGVWEIPGPMGLTPNEFWEPIHQQGPSFWQELEFLPWAKDLIKLLDEATENTWQIITSPSRGLDSRIGKLTWIYRRMPRMLNRVHITGNKELFANPNSVLIDDREDNVIKFNATRGGQGLLFPSPGNSLYNWSHDPVGYTKEAIDELYAFQL